ncbi:LysE family translocator [Rossellomorea vietnamensis]|uniref:LysE family translocator n=1 Tax=Rossellomorea vietnamensis TaxID=218284 RepID=A0ACD4CBX9_9BACI|nr:LysE family translocator [Rossellomorea vietnamensis]UXH46113.1 LysE family translocator [Rossellomorea vietnamensis]
MTAALLFIKSVMIGVAIAAPVGPVGIVCIQRTLAYGRRTGFLSGLGAATADALYGLIAVMGLTVVSGFLMAHQFWIQVWGGVFLLLLGWKTFTSQPPALGTVGPDTPSSVKGFLSVFLLTLTNPLTIFAFIAIFGVFRVGGPEDFLTSLTVVSGVFSGSALWWGILAFVGGWISSRIGPDSLKLINRTAGIVLTIFSVLFLIDLL